MNKIDKIFGFILIFFIWLWFTSFIIGGTLLIGDGEYLEKGAIFLSIGWVSSLGLLIYLYFYNKVAKEEKNE